jgi:hypothetical protein
MRREARQRLLLLGESGGIACDKNPINGAALGVCDGIAVVDMPGIWL